MSTLLQIGVGAGVVILAWVAWRTWRRSRSGELRRLAPALKIEPAQPARVHETGWLENPGGRLPAGTVENVWAGEVLDSRLLLFELAPPGRKADPVALFGVEGKAVPPFDLIPRDGAPAGGEGEVPFTDGERFGEVYRLVCAEPAITDHLFRRDVTGFFERAENLNWRVTSNGAWLGVTTWPLAERERRLSAKHLAAFLEDAKLVFRVLLGESPRPRIR
ncbi:MAG TPA: hypothetical protein VMT85_02065 [Thermoanaerobaculia bacterium]|nr:hypothetical protein [Thermoanaerobaculia bacterium]